MRPRAWLSPLRLALRANLRDDSHAATPQSLNSSFTHYGSPTNNPVLRRPVEFGLRSGVAVMHELDISARRSSRHGHAQRVQDQVGAHMRGELPADHAP